MTIEVQKTQELIVRLGALCADYEEACVVVAAMSLCVAAAMQMGVPIDALIELLREQHEDQVKALRQLCASR